MPIAADAAVAPGLPRSIRTLYTLLHNELVCAVAISNPVRHIYTGGKVCPLFFLLAHQCALRVEVYIFEGENLFFNSNLQSVVEVGPKLLQQVQKSCLQTNIHMKGIHC